MRINLPPQPELDYHTVMAALRDYAFPRKALSDLLSRGTIRRVKKGIYVQSGRGIPLISTEILANMIYGPSHVSFESALSLHGLIPEHVVAVTSATTGKTKEFVTPLGSFAYTHQPHEYFSIGYGRRGIDNDRGFLLATPEKATADQVLKMGGEFSLRSMEELLFENLRMEPSDFQTLDTALFRELSLRSGRRALKFLLNLKEKMT